MKIRFPLALLLGFSLAAVLVPNLFQTFVGYASPLSDEDFTVHVLLHLLAGGFLGVVVVYEDRAPRFAGFATMLAVLAYCVVTYLVDASMGIQTMGLPGMVHKVLISFIGGGLFFALALLMEALFAPFSRS